jgi:hypothetical protein
MAQINAVVFDAFGTLLDIQAMPRDVSIFGPRRLPSAAQEYNEYNSVCPLAELIGEGWLATIVLAYHTLDPVPEVPFALRRFFACKLPTAIPCSHAAPRPLAEITWSSGASEILSKDCNIDTIHAPGAFLSMYDSERRKLGPRANRIAFAPSIPSSAQGIRVIPLSQASQLCEHDPVRDVMHAALSPDTIRSGGKAP